MSRISVIGCGGSGKTTLANILSQKTQIPVHYLDCISYKENWKEVDPSIFKQKHQAWIDQEQWIIEGTMIDFLEKRLHRSTRCIFLDMPRYLCLFRIFKRLFSEYGKTRADMAEGCQENFDWPFLKYVWHFNKQTKPKILEILDKSPQSCEIITIRNKSDLKEWINNS